MKCKAVHKQLIFFIDNELEAGLQQQVENHLQSCKSCRRAYEKMKESYALWDKANGIKADNFYYTRLKAKMQNQAPTARPSHPRVLSPLLIAASIVVGVFIGFLIGISASQSSATVAQQQQRMEQVQMYADNFYLYEIEQEPIESALLKGEIQDNEKDN